MSVSIPASGHTNVTNPTAQPTLFYRAVRVP